MLPESFAASSEKKPLTMWASGAISADQARERSYQQLTPRPIHGSQSRILQVRRSSLSKNATNAKKKGEQLLFIHI